MDDLIAYVTGEGFIFRYIILTHEHFDHCWGANQLVGRFNVSIVCSQLCAEAIKDKKRNCSVFYDNREGFSIDGEIISTESLDNVLRFGENVISFFKTPGHTDASISFVTKQYLFTGDSLIKDFCTVTKLPTGSVVKLRESLCLYRMLQGRGYRVFPGHGEEFDLDGYDLNKMFKYD